MLYLAGPAQAFILGLAISDPLPQIGEMIVIDVSAEIEQNDLLNISQFMAMVNGPSSKTCTFLPNGTKIDCPDISIQVIQQPSFNFGYGYYDQGLFKYKLSLNTSGMNSGAYTIDLSAKEDQNIIDSSQKQFNLVAPIVGTILDQCSLRAKKGIYNGNIVFNGQKNSLNFHVPGKAATLGSGSLTTQIKIPNQKKLARESYSFIVTNAIITGDDTFELEVEGDLQISNTQNQFEQARIYVDKSSKQVSIVGSTFIMDNMNVTFMKWC